MQIHETRIVSYRTTTSILIAIICLIVMETIYLSLAVVNPLNKLSRTVEGQGEKIESIKSMLFTSLTPETAHQINTLYRSRMDDKAKVKNQ